MKIDIRKIANEFIARKELTIYFIACLVTLELILCLVVIKTSNNETLKTIGKIIHYYVKTTATSRMSEFSRFLAEELSLE